MSDGLFTKEELEEMGLDVAEEEVTVDPNAEDIKWIVYYKGELPDCAWSYHFNPPPEKDADGNPILDEDGDPLVIPFARQEYYWDEDKDQKISRHSVANTSTNLKLMDYDTFMENIVPNKDCCKIFDSQADFLLELI